MHDEPELGQNTPSVAGNGRSAKGTLVVAWAGMGMPRYFATSKLVMAAPPIRPDRRCTLCARRHTQSAVLWVQVSVITLKMDSKSNCEVPVNVEGPVDMMVWRDTVVGDE